MSTLASIETASRRGGRSSRFSRIQLALAVGAALAVAGTLRAQVVDEAASRRQVLQTIEVGLADGLAPAEVLDRLPDDPRLLLPGLVHAVAHADGTRTATYVARVWQRVPLADTARAAILVEQLGGGDAVFERTLRGLLADLEGRHGLRRADFSIYRELIEGPVRNDAPLPAVLVDYLFEVDPGQAVLLMMRSHGVRQPQRIRQILWAEHVISAHIWQRDNGFADEARRGRAAVETELQQLAADPSWWARRYAAEVRTRLAG